MNILHVATSDIGGGAEKEARVLFQAFRARGHSAWLAVGNKYSTDADVLVMRNGIERGLWERTCGSLENKLEAYDGKVPGVWRARNWLHNYADVRTAVEERLGFENFNFPATYHLLDLPPQRPDIVHAHNLHGGYFDLRALTEISRQVPVVLTLHDEWMLTGHCAYTLGCERWESGCGQCPDLTTYPSISRDATAWNWKRKQKLYQGSRLWVSAPSRWLMSRADRAGLSPLEKKVIPYGVDFKMFQPGDRRAVRNKLSLPSDAYILLCVANLGKENPFKDYKTIERAAHLLGQSEFDRQIILLVLGGNESTEQAGRITVRHVPYQTDPAAVAFYYQAADLYLHAAKADNFPCTVLESLACATPVVATAVGGIPEQVKGLRPTEPDSEMVELNSHGIDEATGILVPLGDARAMAKSIEHLLNDQALRDQLGKNAERDARQRFSLQRQVDEYLSWYGELIETAKGH